MSKMSIVHLTNICRGGGNQWYYIVQELNSHWLTKYCARNIMWNVCVGSCESKTMVSRQRFI